MMHECAQNQGRITRIAGMLVFLLLFGSCTAFAGLKTGGGYEISNDTFSVAGSADLSGGSYLLITSMGQPSGYVDFFQSLGVYNAGYLVESGYVSGIEAVFATFTLTATSTAPVAGGYLGAGDDVAPGARISYTMTYFNAGQAAIDPLDADSTFSVDNALPAAVTFEPGTIQLNTVPKTDAADADECEYIGGTHKIKCSISLTAGAAGTITWSGILQ